MSSYNVRINRGSKKVISLLKQPDLNIDVNTTEADLKFLASFDDIDIANRQEGYLLMWNELLGVHEYVSPYEVVDRADSNTADYTNEPTDPGVAPGDDAIDYGVF